MLAPDGLDVDDDLDESEVSCTNLGTRLKPAGGALDACDSPWSTGPMVELRVDDDGGSVRSTRDKREPALGNAIWFA